MDQFNLLAAASGLVLLGGTALFARMAYVWHRDLKRVVDDHARRLIWVDALGREVRILSKMVESSYVPDGLAGRVDRQERRTRALKRRGEILADDNRATNVAFDIIRIQTDRRLRDLERLVGGAHALAEADR